MLTASEHGMLKVTADEEPPACTGAEGREQVGKLVQEVGFRQSRWSINTCDFDSDIADLQAAGRRVVAQTSWERGYT